MSDLDDWPEALQPEASQVETSADELKRKYWWKNIEVPGQALSTVHTKREYILQILILISVSIHPFIHPSILSMNPSIQLLSASYLSSNECASEIVHLLQIWAKLIYVLVVITIIIVILLVVSEYQYSALQNVAAAFLLFDFSWLFSSKQIAFISVPVWISPEKS